MHTETNFGSHVFSDRVMRERLPANVYRRLRKTIEEGVPLDTSSAEVIASAMKDWAMGLGATHYTHWFSPMNGQTAEKHDAFVSPMQDGTVIFEFSGKALVRGEADASSFPSGGLRATFEARGYTAWDCSSPAFIRQDPGGITTLCIPTAFCSYTGDALDIRTPLLRSMRSLSEAAVRVLRALGDTRTLRVVPNVGLEQEYFLIDRELYKKRRDLIYTGRTLFGAKPPKGQELDDQYYAAIRQRVSCFMAELNQELWRLGVPAKTQHNEVAPAQHEVAVVFDNAVAACDQNQLTMMLLRKVAARRGLACLLHEKPFAGFNGSGKHNNWSISTDQGENLLNPGKNAESNPRFLLFLMAVISAVHEHADLLRLSCSGLSNDYRLGGQEAPPPVFSVFLGDALLESVATACGCDAPHVFHQDSVYTGVSTIPTLPTDNTDRNRTSPFAFTGNKFEFRMPGSSQAGSTINTVLNTIVAQQLALIADRLEKAENPEAEAKATLHDLFTAHSAILFNGNNYAASWQKEALRRKLPFLASTVDAIPVLEKPETIRLFEDFHVYSRQELLSRVAIRWDTYIKSLRIEAQTLVDILLRQILPAVMDYQAALCRDALDLAGAGLPNDLPLKMAERIAPLASALYQGINDLESATCGLSANACQEDAKAWHDTVLPLMDAARNACDALETLMPQDRWPVPTYGEMLFYV